MPQAPPATPYNEFGPLQTSARLKEHQPCVFDMLGQSSRGTSGAMGQEQVYAGDCDFHCVKDDVDEVMTDFGDFQGSYNSNNRCPLVCLSNIPQRLIHIESIHLVETIVSLHRFKRL